MKEENDRQYACIIVKATYKYKGDYAEHKRKLEEALEAAVDRAIGDGLLTPTQEEDVEEISTNVEVTHYEQ